MNKDEINHRVIAQQNRRSPSKSNCWITTFHDESVPATSKYSSIHVKQITGYYDLTMECFQCAIFVNVFRAIWKKLTCQQFRFFINLTNKIIFQRKRQKTRGYNWGQRGLSCRRNDQYTESTHWNWNCLKDYKRYEKEWNPFIGTVYWHLIHN